VTHTVPASQRPTDAAPALYADVVIRTLAVVVDGLLLSMVFFPVTRIVKGTWLMHAEDHRWVDGWFVTDPLCLAFLAVIFLYFVLFEAYPGATPGKLLCGLRVVTPDGSRVGLARSLTRNLLRVIDSLPTLGILAVVLISTSSERARFGDRVAGTRVVRAR
jgi:uncharacterized RDD family membrane protein YckC